MKQKSKFLDAKRENLTSICVDTKFTILFLLLIFGAVVLGCKVFSRFANPGGTVFTVEIQTNEPNRNEIIERAIKVTESRLNNIGADAEVAKVSGKDNQISVKIYHPNDVERLKRFLFTTYQLELKKVVSSPYPAQLQIYPNEESVRDILTPEQEVLPYEEMGGETRQMFVIVEKTPVINGEDIRDANTYSTTNLENDFAVTFSLKPEAAAKFGDWTGKNINSYLAVVLDKKVQSAPFIRGQIFDNGQIDGRFTRESAENTAMALKSGYLPATMKIIKEENF